MQRCRFSLLFLSFWLLLGAIPPDKGDDRHDPALLGRWRSPAPVGPEDFPEVFEFRFDKKGKAMMFHVQYTWEASSQSWSPSVATQPAQGDDDTWESENGFLTFRIRERYIKNRDLVVRYTIDADTISFHMAEIYARKSEEKDGLWGEWHMETYDQNFPEEKRTRQFLLSEGGILREKANGQAYTTQIFPGNTGWKQLRNTQLASGQTQTDTVFQPYLCTEDRLYLYQEKPWIRLTRRPEKNKN